MVLAERCHHHVWRLKSFILAGVLTALLGALPAAAAERLAVSAPMANIRSGPAATHDILWKVEKYHPLQILESSGKWYRFRDFEGDEGWIHASMVGKIPALITVQNQCNIRSGPGPSFPVLFTVGSGIPFKILQQQGNWFQIQHADGDKGWIHKSLIW